MYIEGNYFRQESPSTVWKMDVGGKRYPWLEWGVGWGIVGVWCLLGKVRNELKPIHKLGPGEISALGKKLLQGTKEREKKRGKIPGRKS